MLINYFQHFSQGETLENVSKELKRVMENGHFKLIIKCKQIIYISKLDGGGLDECHSKFVLHCVSETWNIEQIDDFVRKLGFLENQTTDVDQAKSFQQLYQVIEFRTSYILVSQENQHQNWEKCLLLQPTDHMLSNELYQIISKLFM